MKKDTQPAPKSTHEPARILLSIGDKTTTLYASLADGNRSYILVDVGGELLDKKIMYYLEKRRGLIIGERAAADIRGGYHQAQALYQQRHMKLTGRRARSAVPTVETITLAEIRACLYEPMMKIHEALRRLLLEAQTPLKAHLHQGNGSAKQRKNIPTELFTRVRLQGWGDAAYCVECATALDIDIQVELDRIEF